MTRDAAITLAKKLKTLAEKATGGERDTAKAKLFEFCQKHGLDEDDYCVDQIKGSIPFNGDHEKMLLSAIVCMVMEKDSVKGTLDGNKFVFNCTTREFEDVTECFKHYKKIYYDYIEGVMTSMIVRNEIKNPRPPQSDFKMEDMSPEERAEFDEFMKKNTPEKEPEEEPSDKTAETPAPTPPSSDEALQQMRKDDRCRRIFMVMEQNKWARKFRARLFLR